MVSSSLEFSKRVKFSLNKEELEELIIKLDQSSKMLTRFRSRAAEIHQGYIQSSSRTIAKLASVLSRVQTHVNCLYSAVSRRWMSGCHPEHNVRLYLDSHSAPLQKKRSSVAFRLALLDMQSNAMHDAWQDAHVEVMEDDLSGACDTSRSV